MAAAAGIVAPILSSRGRHARYSSVIGRAISVQFVFVTVAASALIYALVSADFPFAMLRSTPLGLRRFITRVTGLWGALKVLCFTGMDFDNFFRSGHGYIAAPGSLPWVLMVFSIVSFLLAVIAFVSNPFESLSPVPPDGRSLNPLLEDANVTYRRCSTVRRRPDRCAFSPLL